MAQIQISRTIIDGNIEEKKDTSFKGVTITKPVYKYSISAQSGQAYLVNTLTAIGKSGN
jgi:hypothetical protein